LLSEMIISSRFPLF